MVIMENPAVRVWYEFRAMWQPTERIKHELPPGAWPTAEQAAEAKLFQPLVIGPRLARTRTWVPAMVPWRATEDGFVTKDVIDWYARFAKGRPGVIVIEATGIRDVASGPLLRIGHDRFVPGLKELTAAVKAASGGQTLLFIQLIDFLAIRRRPQREKYFARFLEITDAHRAALGNDGGDDELRTRLAALVGRGGLVAVRGLGMLIGLELESPAATQRVVERCRERGVLVGWTLHRDRVVRLAPPLTLSDDELDLAVQHLAAALAR
jgi:hypothetical protein